MVNGKLQSYFWGAAGPAALSVCRAKRGMEVSTPANRIRDPAPSLLVSNPRQGRKSISMEAIAESVHMTAATGKNILVLWWTKDSPLQKCLPFLDSSPSTAKNFSCCPTRYSCYGFLTLPLRSMRCGTKKLTLPTYGKGAKEPLNKKDTERDQEGEYDPAGASVLRLALFVPSERMF